MTTATWLLAGGGSRCSRQVMLTGGGAMSTAARTRGGVGGEADGADALVHKIIALRVTRRKNRSRS